MYILKNVPTFLLLNLVIIFGANGCSNSPETTINTATSESILPLTPKIEVESFSDWVILYDAQTHTSMDAWTGFNQEEIPEKWEIIDGLLTISKEGNAVDKNTGFGQSIVSKELFDNFELEVHYRMSEGANSGIMYHVTQASDYKDDYETGPEYQLLDNQLAPSESLPHRQVASLYDMYAPQISPYLPAGQWNLAGIRVLNNEVEHWLNEELVLQYNLKSDDFLQRKIESKWYDDPDWAMAGIGHISLQDHGDKVEFKRVAVRRIK
tara:strand:+ start:5304 stop:6101 length:798 start_codon:yes stop_codon:yes gene_type:complete